MKEIMHKLIQVALFAFLLSLVLSCTDKKANSNTEAKPKSSLQNDGTVHGAVSADKVKELKAIQQDIQKESQELEELLKEIEK